MPAGEAEMLFMVAGCQVGGGGVHAAVFPVAGLTVSKAAVPVAFPSVSLVFTE